MAEEETKKASAKAEEASATTTDERQSAPQSAASSLAEAEVPVFPTPKYVVTIVSPRTLLLHENDAVLDDWKEFEQSSSSSNKNNDTATATSILNLHVLLVSLLNRLLRARLFPRRAVHSYITPAGGTDDKEWVIFNILTPANVLPILLAKCEHFGVGNLVGLVYAVPLETCVLPLLRTTIEEEEEEQGLLTVPAVRFSVPSSAGSVAAASTTTTSKPDDVLVITAPTLPTHKRLPTPAALRPTVSETLPALDDDPTMTSALPMASTTEDGPPTAGLQRSLSHPDLLQTSTTAADDNGKKKDAKDKKGDSNSTAESSSKPKQQPKEEHLLEMIPEAKASVKKMDTTGAADKADSTRPPTKDRSVLIEKVLEARKEWLATASRIRVEQVAEEVQAAAALTWDYLLFVVCAAAIAATGLATNSSVTVLASMLVSPIMGPILAVTFGTMIRRPVMIQKALRNEAISLLLCILVGACGSLVVWWTRLYESNDWPAAEMVSRGETTVLAAGVLIALPSGMATALSTLGKNSSGLVGVAISLSLLPPAVNAGLCWMFALLDSTRLVDKEPDDDTNYWKVGTTSFGLTLLNILCIWLAGVFTFWLKEVAPIERKNAFWSRDLKIARHPPKEVGTGKIREGLQAAIELKKTYSAEAGEPDDTTVQAANVLRRPRRHFTSPTSRWEDALMLDYNPGSSLPELPPPDRRLDRANSDGILERTEALGGIDKASEVLFSNQIFNVNGESMFGSNANQNPSYQSGFQLSYHPETVPPEDVYQEILWRRYRNPKV